MNLKEYQELCKKTTKKFDTSRFVREVDKSVTNLDGAQEPEHAPDFSPKVLDTDEKEIFTWGLGIAGEAGDVASCIKKTFAHNNDQKEGIKENLGDTLWYSAMICNFFGWNFEDVLQENIAKLKKRYPQGFTTEDARREGTKIDWNEEAQ